MATAIQDGCAKARLAQIATSAGTDAERLVQKSRFASA
jgi:hypothetical protein